MKMYFGLNNLHMQHCLDSAKRYHRWLHNVAAYLSEQILCHECAYDAVTSCLSRQLIMFLEQGLREFIQYGSHTHHVSLMHATFTMF